jgi:putative restriction endonuclease
MPDLSFDGELRAATFAHVQVLRARYGGRIPRAALMEGVTFRDARVPIWNYMKGIFKPAALGRDGAALSIQTSAESPYADVHDVEAGRFVYKYRGTDIGHPDNVALRRAMAAQRPLLYLVAVDPGVYDGIFPVYVAEDNPGRLEFALVADQQQQLVGAVADDAMIAIRRHYTTRAVMQRLHQQQFRRHVLTAYRDQCAICRLKHVELLDAAHILPDSDPRGEPLVSNGLGLCKIHHSAYDVGILGIDADVKVHIRVDVLAEVDGPMLRYGLQAVHGGKLTLPRRAEQRPNRDFLAERFERFRAA